MSPGIPSIVALNCLTEICGPDVVSRECRPGRGKLNSSGSTSALEEKLSLGSDFFCWLLEPYIWLQLPRKTISTTSRNESPKKVMFKFVESKSLQQVCKGKVSVVFSMAQPDGIFNVKGKRTIQSESRQKQFATFED
nr:hypothetical protein [Tanacetum cinerariifolium]